MILYSPVELKPVSGSAFTPFSYLVLGLKCCKAPSDLSDLYAVISLLLAMGRLVVFFVDLFRLAVFTEAGGNSTATLVI